MKGLPITVGYSKGLAVFMLLSGILILGVAVLTQRLFPQAITGGILLGISLGYLTRPFFVVAEGAVQLKNIFGMTVKTYPFRALSDLRIRDGKLFVGGQKARVTRWFADSGDWARLEAALAGRG